MTTSAPRNILVVADNSDRPSPALQRVASLAQHLASSRGGTWSLFTSQSDEAVWPELRCLGARELFACPVVESRRLLPEFLAPSICRLVRERAFDCILGPASSLGKDLLPRVAGSLDAPYVGDCIGVRVDGENACFLKPVYAGSAVVECWPQVSPVVVAVRSTEFGVAAPTHTHCPVVLVDVVEPNHGSAQSIELLGIELASSQRPDLAEARTVVSGGRLLGDRFFELLGPLADFYGAALGATRALCDSGHVPSNLQVGQTGRIVSPELYFAVGISGSIQHLAGMRSSRVVVAINCDPEAAIFAHADFGLVGDMWHAVPALVAELRNAGCSSSGS